MIWAWSWWRWREVLQALIRVGTEERVVVTVVGSSLKWGKVE